MTTNLLTITETLTDLFEYLYQEMHLYFDGKNTFYWDTDPWDETDIELANPQDFFECLSLDFFPGYVGEVIFNYDAYRFISPREKAKIEKWLVSHNEEITIEWDTSLIAKIHLEKCMAAS